MNSGPKELAAYHAQVLESERKPHQKGHTMNAARFNPGETLDPETEAIAAERVARMGLSATSSDKQPLPVPDATEEFKDQQERRAIENDQDRAPTPPDKPARKPRSDKGQPRPVKPKVEAPASASGGVLTEAEINHIKVLVDALNSAILASFAAETRTKRASAELNDYLDARTAR